MSHGPATRHDRGQAAIEAALAMPVVVFGLLLILHGTVAARDVLTIQQAAATAARVASAGGTDNEVESAAQQASGPLGGTELQVEIDPSPRARGDIATITVEHPLRVRIPVFSRWLSSTKTISASASALVEAEP